jgi:citrate lyase subunit beta/citryl-CoA lyase
MKLRSMLFVPGDSAKKFARARDAQADALILDLEDSVAPAKKDEARAHVASLLGAEEARNWRFFVRINPFESGLALDDLAAVVAPGLDGILLPKANGAVDVIRLGHCLDALETRAGMTRGAVKVVVVSTETAAALFALGTYAPAHERLVGLTWGAEDLAAAIGATTNKDAQGGWGFPYLMARTNCLFASTAAGVSPIDTLYADFRDPEGLAVDCRAARRDGFTGRIAIHPDQVAIINECFTPSETDVALARKIVAAFEAEPDRGAVGIDGQMYDIPHLKAARKTLAAAGEI